MVRILFDVDVDVNGGLNDERLVRALRWPFGIGTGAGAG